MKSKIVLRIVNIMAEGCFSVLEVSVKQNGTCYSNFLFEDFEYMFVEAGIEILDNLFDQAHCIEKKVQKYHEIHNTPS